MPPVVLQILNSPELVSEYDLSGVSGIFSGGAPLSAETAAALSKTFPTRSIRQVYGLEETCVVINFTDHFDIWFGSSVSMITGVEARIIGVECTDVIEHGRAGELWVKSPSVVLGYLNNQKASRETFVTDAKGDRWLRTGAELLIRPAPSGTSIFSWRFESGSSSN